MGESRPGVLPLLELKGFAGMGHVHLLSACDTVSEAWSASAVCLYGTKVMLDRLLGETISENLHLLVLPWHCQDHTQGTYESKIPRRLYGEPMLLPGVREELLGEEEEDKSQV